MEKEIKKPKSKSEADLVLVSFYKMKKCFYTFCNMKEDIKAQTESERGT